jgi:hypothetical protein
MDIIVPNIKRYSDGEIDRAFMREIKNGFALERATEQQRVNQAVKEATALKGTEHPVLGKPVATMPAREFFRLTQKYGHEEVHSKKFLNTDMKKFIPKNFYNTTTRSSLNLARTKHNAN